MPPVFFDLFVRNNSTWNMTAGCHIGGDLIFSFVFREKIDRSMKRGINMLY